MLVKLITDDLQDREPFEEIDSLECGEDLELFEIVPNGLYPKYIYRLDVPEARGTPPESPNLIPFADPVRSGRCLLFRSNLLAQRLERWEIESGVMIFSPGRIFDVAKSIFSIEFFYQDDTVLIF